MEVCEEAEVASPGFGNAGNQPCVLGPQHTSTNFAPQSAAVLDWQNSVPDLAPRRASDHLF